MRQYICCFPYIIVGALVLPISPLVTQAATPKVQAAVVPTARVAYGQLPLSFEPNLGQAAPNVLYLAHGSGFTLFLTTSGAVLLPISVGHDVHTMISGHQAGPRVAPTHRKPAPARLTLTGANARPTVEGRDRLSGTVNYFIGNNPKRWHTAIPTYARVVYRNVYPGIDQVWSGQSGQPAYAFVVRPGVNPAVIRPRVSGGTSAPGQAGSFVLLPVDGVSARQTPLIYPFGPARGLGLPAQSPTAGNVRSAQAVDTQRQSLAINPTLSYGTYLGGTNEESGNGIAVDARGNAYVTGYTTSTNFPATPGALQSTRVDSGAESTAFVTKLNPAGTAAIYTTFLGGTGSTDGAHIAIDQAGHAYKPRRDMGYTYGA